MTSPRSVAIVLGLSPTGLYAVRELARAGISVIGVGAPGEAGLASRHLSAPEQRWPLDTPEEVVERLMAMPPADGARPVLFPTNDTFIEILSRNRSDLSRNFTFATSYGKLAESLMDKRRLYELCVTHGIPSPRVWTAEHRDELAALAGALPFPCILKPVLIHRARTFLAGKKVILVRSAGELRSVIPTIPAETGAWLVQEIVPGPESEIGLFGGYFDRTGRVRQTYTGRKLRQYPPGFGSASLVVSETIPEIAGTTARLLGALEFRGVCGSEFKRDPRDGQWKMIEINPRPTLWFQATHGAGKQIMAAAFEDLANGSALPDEPMLEGVVWRYGLKDLASAFFYRFRSSGFVFAPPDVAPARRASARTWAVFDRRDPAPSLTEVTRYYRRWRERS